MRSFRGLLDSFRLRREEAIKFQAHYADHGATLQLKANWSKGGRAGLISAELCVINRYVKSVATRLVTPQ